MIKALMVAVAAGFCVAACAIGESNYETVTYPVRVASEVRTCEPPFAKPDVGSLKACGDGRGKGHCYDGSKTMVTGLPACDGSEVCVPDKILSASGDKLKECTFFVNGKPGVCMSVLVDQVFKNKDVLKQESCDADERCIPCVDPTNNQDTKLCEPVGVYENACQGGSGAKAESCCHGAGACIGAEAAPEDQRDSLSRETCSSGKLCAPAALVDGNPVKCDVIGGSGVCLDLCFAKMASPFGKLLRSSCRPTEVCVPCLVGKGQGLPGCD